MRDRLIELIKRGGVIIPQTAEAVADYLLANGVIVPKVKVGDHLYYISAAGLIIENKVFYVGEYAKGFCYATDGTPILENTFLGARANCDYYFTREEAEKAMEGSDTM